MKIKGVKIEGPMVETIYIPRGDGVDTIVLKAAAIMDFADFEKVCPEPQPSIKLLPGGKKVSNIDDPAYKAAITEHNTKRVDWIILESLKATEDLEWDTVDLGDPSTWNNYRKELRDAGFSDVEVGRIVTGCMVANALDDTKLKAARDSFLAGTQDNKENS